MKKSATSHRWLPRPRRAASAVGALLVLAVPVGFLAAQQMSDAGARAAAARREQAGVAYLRPLTALVSALSRAQSLAVGGSRPDGTPVLSALSAVDAADASYGNRLGTGARWADLRQQVVQLTSEKETGRHAFADYSDTIDTVLALVGAVGTGAGLTVDPGTDSALLVDAVLVRLPALVVDSGRMADLALEAEQGTASARPTLTAQVLTARDRVSTTAATLDSDLATSFDSSADPDLASALADPVDQLRDTVSTMAPPTPLVDLGADLADAGQIASSRAQLDTASDQLDTGLLNGLDALLRTRAAHQRELEAGGAAAVLTAVLAAGWLLWTLPPSESRHPRDRAVVAVREEPGRHRAALPAPDAVGAAEAAATSAGNAARIAVGGPSGRARGGGRDAR